ncbi:DUF2938 domain-containing protein [Achromobacter insolitus]|uniref:DUF2938 domain-containing protein n=1 Tax=Achromobacter insolitus TaxID=217204 RepID=UPI0020A2E0B2|nr:DUF2938 domain-containing protein [Achromobacter insolitus]
MVSMEATARIILIGVGATAVMDLWGLVQKGLGIPTLSYGLVGRWAGHLRRGKFAHANIGRAEPIAGEVPLGWAIHYTVGIVFAALLACVQGEAWLRNPTWLPALAVGVATVVIPFFVMQPAMGLGLAAARAPSPRKARARSLATHAVFGCGLYLSAVLLQQVWE